MKKQKWKTFLLQPILILGLLFAPLFSEAGRINPPHIQKVAVKKELTQQFNEFLKVMIELHSFLVEQDTSGERKALNKFHQIVKNIKTLAPLAPQQQIHINKIMQTMDHLLEVMQMAQAEQRMDALKEIFRIGIEIIRTYEVDRYTIFYCKKDNSEWFQKELKARHPFGVKKGGVCGVKMK